MQGLPRRKVFNHCWRDQLDYMRVLSSWHVPGEDWRELFFRLYRLSFGKVEHVRIK